MSSWCFALCNLNFTINYFKVGEISKFTSFSLFLHFKFSFIGLTLGRKIGQIAYFVQFYSIDAASGGPWPQIMN
jgi:hypothetical protein